MAEWLSGAKHNRVYLPEVIFFYQKKILFLFTILFLFYVYNRNRLYMEP